MLVKGAAAAGGLNSTRETARKKKDKINNFFVKAAASCVSGLPHLPLLSPLSMVLNSGSRNGGDAEYRSDRCSRSGENFYNPPVHL